MNLFQVMNRIVKSDGRDQKIEVEITSTRSPARIYTMTVLKVDRGPENEITFRRPRDVGHGSEVKRYYWNRPTTTDFMRRTEVKEVILKRRIVSSDILIKVIDDERQF